MGMTKSIRQIKNNTFVITGETETSRDDLKAQILSYEGRVTISPSGRTNFLVVGTEPGEKKLEKAKKLKITVISEEELKEMFAEAERLRSVEDVEFGIVEGLSEHELEELEPYNKNKGKKEEIKEIIESELWVEKYRPKCLEDFCGNNAALKRVQEFLNTPVENLEKKGILLSGVPGIGKTTAAHLLCKLAGKNVLEFNASDVRNKAGIKNIASIGMTLDLKHNSISRSVIIMDEVDGISDRGGLPELAKLIKKTKVHIICMANEKGTKLKTLLSHVEDIHFRRLEFRQIKTRVENILENEGLKVNATELNKLLLKGHGDFRFILNQLQTFASGHLSLEASKVENKSVFENVMAIFNNSKVDECINMFFEDADFIPLLVHENYIKPPFHGKKPSIEEYKRSAEFISNGELNSSIKQKSQNYSFGYMEGYWYTRPVQKVGRCDFTGWLGQNSKRRKYHNLIKELNYHGGRNAALTSKQTYRIYKLPAIYLKILHLMKSKKVDECLSFLKEEGFVKDDVESLVDVLDEKFGESRAFKLACNRNPWSFSYTE